MTRRMSLLSAFVLLLAMALGPSSAAAIDEPDRLWLVGERAFADGLYPLARRTLERFVERYPRDARVGQALLLLGKTRFVLRDLERALDAIRRARAAAPPGQALEARFWEGETLFQLKRYAEARAAYDDVLRTDAATPFAADALYGYGWTELQLGRPDSVAGAFRDLVQTWPEHRLAASATYHLARVLIDLKRPAEAVPLLAQFSTKYPGAPVVPDAQYLLGVARLGSGDTEAALADFKAFVDAHPAHALAASATYQLAHALIDLKRPAEAVPLLVPFRARYPGTPLLPDAQFLLAVARLGSGDTKAALADLKAFTEAYPTHPLRAEARKLGRQEGARIGDKGALQEVYADLMGQTPPTADGLAEAAAIAARLGQPREQHLALRKLVAEFPTHPAAQRAAFDAAGAAFQRKDWKEAAMWAATATRSEDEALRAEAWLLAGESELKLKRAEAAVKAFEAAINIAGAENAVRYRALAGLGLAREEQSALPAALAAYDAVAASSPDGALRDWAKERASAVRARLTKPSRPPAGGAKRKGSS